MSRGGGGDSTAKLVGTAVSAAIAGAAVAVVTLKWLQRKRERQFPDATQLHSKVVFEDSSGREEASIRLMPHQHEEKMRQRIAARALVEEDNSQPRDSVTVRVPATSANMGPGCK